MGKDLMEIYPYFTKTIMECEQWLLRNGYPGCLGIILGKSSCEEAFPTAIFALEVALARLFVSWGIVPKVVVGHR